MPRELPGNAAVALAAGDLAVLCPADAVDGWSREPALTAVETLAFPVIAAAALRVGSEDVRSCSFESWLAGGPSLPAPASEGLR